MHRLALAVAALALAGTAAGAQLPGVKTPSRNISCFVVPIRPTTHANLLCDVHQAAYLRDVQRACMARDGLDWHGFSLPWNRAAMPVCAGGVMYDPRDTPHLVVLAYGRAWRSHGFTCVSRRSGLTCTTAGGHGLFLSRERYRLW